MPTSSCATTCDPDPALREMVIMGRWARDTDDTRRRLAS
jgi:hypothetical protein